MRAWTTIPRAIASPRNTLASVLVRLGLTIRPRLAPALIAAVGVSAMIGAISLMSADFPRTAASNAKRALPTRPCQVNSVEVTSTTFDRKGHSRHPQRSISAL